MAIVRGGFGDPRHVIFKLDLRQSQWIESRFRKLEEISPHNISEFPATGPEFKAFSTNTYTVLPKKYSSRFAFHYNLVSVDFTHIRHDYFTGDGARPVGAAPTTTSFSI